MSNIDDDTDESEDSGSTASTPSAIAPATYTTTGQSPMNPTLTAYLQNISNSKQDMEDAQSKANTNRLIASMGRAGAQLGHAVSGDQTALDTSAYDSFDKEADAPVKDVLAQQKSQNDQSSNIANQVKTAGVINSNDPNSPQAKAVQTMLAKVMKRPVEDFAGVTPAMAPQFGKVALASQKIDAASNDRADKQDQKASEKQTANYNTATSLAEQMRGSPAVSQAEKDIYASQKVNTLFSKYGDLNQLSPQMANLATAEVAKIASNAAPDDHMMQMLSPNAFHGQLANLWQKVTNDPSPANAGAFLQQYKDYADGITQDAHKVIQDRYGRIYATRHSQWSPDQQQSFQDAYLNRFDDAASAAGTSQSGAKRQVSADEISQYAQKHGMTPDAAKSWLGSQGYGVN